MKLKYFFTAIVSALLFMGCSEDNDPAGPLNNIRLSETYAILPTSGGSAKVTINSTDSWAFKNVVRNEETGKLMLVDSKGKETQLWLELSQLSGAAGSTELTITADAVDGGREVELVIGAGGNTQILMVRQGSLEAVTATCAEVISGSDGKTFRVKGTCTAIANTTYGNWYLNDGTGEIYIYGTLDAEGKTKNFESLGIELGDIVEVEGPKTTYNSTVELVDVTVLKITKSLLKIVTPEPLMDMAGGEIDVKVAYKGSGAYVNIPEEGKDWILYKNTEFIKGVPTKLEANPADTAVFKFEVLTNMSETRSAALTFQSSNGGGSTSMDYTITQKGAIIKGSIAEFNLLEDSDEPHLISGVITQIKNTTYGNMYIKDGTGEAYVYGTLTASGEKKQFETLGLNVGDVVTLKGPKGSYNGSPQMVNGVYQKHIAVPGGATAISIADFRNVEDSKDTYYLLTGVVGEVTESGAKDDISTYGNFNITDLTGSVYVYGVLTGWEGEKGKFGTLGVKYGDTITILATKSTYKGLIEAVGIYVSHVAGE